MSREELIAKNGELVQSRQRSPAPRASAPRPRRRRAQQATAETQKAKALLQQKLDAEHAKVEQLQKELKKVSTSLKD